MKLTIMSLTIALIGMGLDNHIMAQEPTSKNDGWAVLHSFKNAPFPDESRANGHTYDGKFYSTPEHYSDSTVGIYIPPSFKPDKKFDFVVHFHGWNNHVSNVFERYELKRQFDATGLNAILLVPEGPQDAPDSSGGKFERLPGAFKALMEEVFDYLKTEHKLGRSKAIGNITLTAHSGGYNVVSAILKHGGLREQIMDVVLFDASYGGLDGYVDWVSEGHGRRLVSIFTEHLAVRNYQLITMLQSKAIPFQTLMDGALTEQILAPRKAIFIHTMDIEHDEVMQKRDYFALFLKGAKSSSHSHD